MDLPVTPSFAHRYNRNGTIDSICKSCFATIATSNWEFALEQKELAHSCDPHTLERYHGREARNVTAPFVIHKRQGAGTHARPH